MDKLCVSKLCVDKLCGDKLCVVTSCVWTSCVVKLCVKAAGVMERAGGSAQPKTRTPHKDVGNKPKNNEMVVDDVRGFPTEVIFSTLVLLVQVYSLPCMFRSFSYVSVWCDVVVEASCCSRELLPQV